MYKLCCFFCCCFFCIHCNHTPNFAITYSKFQFCTLLLFFSGCYHQHPWRKCGSAFVGFHKCHPTSCWNCTEHSQDWWYCKFDLIFINYLLLRDWGLYLFVDFVNLAYTIHMPISSNHSARLKLQLQTTTENGINKPCPISLSIMMSNW